LEEYEKTELVKIFDQFNKLKHSTAIPKAFTEKGLYMLATILKSQKATQTMNPKIGGVVIQTIGEEGMKISVKSLQVKLIFLYL